MTRTGLSPKLGQHRREPLVDVHPAMIARMRLEQGGLARVTTASGSSLYRVQSNDGQRRNDLFVPIHWTDQQSAGGRTGLLPGQARDPHSGQPGFKNTPARIEAVQVKWHAFFISRGVPSHPDCLYWTQVRVAGGYVLECAGQGDAMALLKLLPPGQLAEVRDERRGLLRAAVIADGQLIAALFAGPPGSLPSRDWLIDQLGADQTNQLEVLAGRPAAPQSDRGPIVCACFDVGLTSIAAAIRSQNLTSVEDIGAALKAGTNCGSCRPELSRMLAAQRESNFV
jgi:assimilatory nitrate reductase catalytic subunit